MKIYLHITLLIAQFLMCCGFWQSASAQLGNSSAVDSPTALNSEQVVNKLVQRNLERAQSLAAYQGTRIYRLEYHGFPGSRSAEMTVDVKYRSPGTKEFSVRSEEGSRLVIDRVFQVLLQNEKEALSEENQARVALNNDNYRFAMVGIQTMPTGPCYILAVEPLTKNKLLYRGRIWVDAEDFAVVRIEATPAKNPSFWTKETKIEQVYAKVGEFWLPLSNRSNSTIRLGGHAYFTIQYREYQVTAITPPGKPNPSQDTASAILDSKPGLRNGFMKKTGP
jgi:outer membrane lipoprotein-sorting protein